MDLAPIVLFVYNRPEHTLKTLEALKQNEYADKSILYIYADGFKANAALEEIEKIEEVRTIIKSQLWCKHVSVIESSYNKGLANSIVDGINEVLNEFNSIIVLEDDIITSPKFLSYMNDSLEFYKNEEKVMHVSGFIQPIDYTKQSFFFFNQTSCWGWATWKRSWNKYQPDATVLLDEIKRSGREREFNMDNSYPFMQHLMNNVNGTWNTWAIKWHASVFLLNGLCLHPNKSYTKNIGMDGTGTHCDTNTKYYIDQLNNNIFKPVTKFKQDKVVLKKIIKFNKHNFTNNNNGIIYRVFRKLKNKLIIYYDKKSFNRK